MDEKAAVLAQMDIPFLRQPVSAQLDALAAELRAQWVAFNRELKQGKLTHLEYDKDTQRLTWRKPTTPENGARMIVLSRATCSCCRRARRISRLARVSSSACLEMKFCATSSWLRR